ncbi:unnamed protein product [Prorocentrum cordatum]|uniref:Uncharacterized protein n=1 Tax=Prorocentrum cordatum TaxID=2364126 RepID=A0ABN9T3A0_9DINO|nr:unnamed protein product [Polarella glacialis]
MLCWLQRWHHEREERRCWAQQVMLEKRTMEQERAHDRIKSVMEAQAQLEELSKASPKRKPVRLTSVDGPGLTMRTEKPQRFKPLSMSKFMSEPPMRTEAQTRPSTWSLGDSKSLQSLQCLRGTLGEGHQRRGS